MPKLTAQRFWAKVRKAGPNDCWPWAGGCQSRGYGSFGWDGQTHLAHRLAYEAAHGPIPDGLTIDHRCRNKLCQNPAHMEPVTASVNARRGRRWWA